MANSYSGFSWVSFVGGIAAGVALHKYWGPISGQFRPLAAGAAVYGKDAVLDAGRSVIKEKAGRFADVILEIKKEEKDRGKCKPETSGDT